MIEAGDVLAWQDFGRRLPQNALASGAERVFAVADEPAQQANRVGFQDRRPLVEGDRGDRAGRVAADAGKRHQLVDGLWELAVELGDDHLCRRVQLPCAAVVAEAFPQPQHVLFVGGGQSADIRQCDNEPLEVVADRGHLRLLQHDLADPDAVGVARLPPGQVAGMFGIPGKQPPAEQLLLGRREMAVVALGLDLRSVAVGMA